jgi:uncharacterized damage-inducible protein DinB
MLTDTQRQEHIAEIERLPTLIAAAVNGLNDEQLDTPYRAGGWTARQVVHHLADAHINAYARIRLTLTEERPTLKTYEQDAWAKLPDAARLPVEPSLAILRGLHERWAALFKSLPRESWARTAVHPENGEMSLDDMLQLYARHGAKHASQVQGLRERQRW